MALIFVMSMQPAEQSSQLSGGIVSKLIAALFHNFDTFDLQRQQEIIHLVSFLVRKAAHFSEYFILCALACLTTKVYTLEKYKVKTIMVFLFCVLYALSDEIHQYFVPGRACRIFDIGIDTAGILTAIIFIFIISRYFKTRKTGDKNA